MAEPEGFKSKEAAENWIAGKKKEFFWLMDQCKKATSKEAKDKAHKKLQDWLDDHPKLQNKVVDEVANMIKDGKIEWPKEDLPGSPEWQIQKIKELDELFNDEVWCEACFPKDSQDAWHHGVKGFMASQASKIAVLQSILEERDKQINELVILNVDSNKQTKEALRLARKWRKDAEAANEIVGDWQKFTDNYVDARHGVKKKVRKIKRLKY